MPETVVLVLDYAYNPVELLNWTKAITLIYLNKAEVIEEGLEVAHTINADFKIPSVIRKFSTRTLRKKRVSLHKANIFLRDQYCCQYCGEEFGKETLTIDHVIPRSKGGLNTWTNVTTACFSCNQQKAWRSLKQSGMLLLNQPKEPSWNQLITLRLKRISNDTWRKFHK